MIDELDELTIETMFSQVGKESFLELVPLFVSDAQKQITAIGEQLEKAAQSQWDFQALESAAHSLKGVCLTYGLKGLGTKAHALEIASRDSNQPQVEILSQEIATHAEQALETYRCFINDTPAQ